MVPDVSGPGAAAVGDVDGKHKQRASAQPTPPSNCASAPPVIVRNSAYSSPESKAAAGSVNTHAAAMLFTVDHCRPLLFAAMVPATPELSTWVVLTGSPRVSAAKMRSRRHHFGRSALAIGQVLLPDLLAHRDHDPLPAPGPWSPARQRATAHLHQGGSEEHLTYGQGAAAEVVAAATIFAADTLGLPVSTTHVLSSGVAGTMAANKSGLQWSTVKSIAAAWVFTLPAAALLSGLLYALFRTMTGGA